MKHTIEEIKEGSVENQNKQAMKQTNKQAESNRETKNEDALFKFITYSGMLEKKRREDINVTRKNDMIAFTTDSFEQYYKGELLTDSKREPRPINEEDFKGGKRVVDQASVGEGF